MELKTEKNVIGRIIEIGYRKIVIAYMDNNGMVDTLPIYNENLEKFKLGDIIHYSEYISIKRVVDSGEV